MSPCCPHVLGSVIHTKTAFTYTYQTQKKMSEDKVKPRYAPSPPMSPFENDEFIHRGYDFENSFKVSLKNNTEKDKCVKCGEITMYEKNVHIDRRMGYVEGAGQLCNDCFIQGFQCG